MAGRLFRALFLMVLSISLWACSDMHPADRTIWGSSFWLTSPSQKCRMGWWLAFKADAGEVIFVLETLLSKLPKHYTNVFLMDPYPPWRKDVDVRWYQKQQFVYNWWRSCADCWWALRLCGSWIGPLHSCMAGYRWQLGPGVRLVP